MRVCPSCGAEPTVHVAPKKRKIPERLRPMPSETDRSVTWVLKHDPGCSAGSPASMVPVGPAPELDATVAAG